MSTAVEVEVGLRVVWTPEAFNLFNLDSFHQSDHTAADDVCRVVWCVLLFKPVKICQKTNTYLL